MLVVRVEYVDVPILHANVNEAVIILLVTLLATTYEYIINFGSPYI